MEARSRPTRLILAASLALFASQAFVTGAMAAKEKFERTKPHVNVGTIGKTETPGDLTTGQSTGVVVPPADCEDRPNNADGTPHSECAPQE